MHQNPAGGAADQRRHIGAVVTGGQRGLITQADAIDEAHVHVDDLKALLIATTAGDHLGLVVDVAGVPQTVGGEWRRAFCRIQLRGCRVFTDTGCQLMHHTVFNIQHTPQRPGQTGV